MASTYMAGALLCDILVLSPKCTEQSSPLPQTNTRCTLTTQSGSDPPLASSDGNGVGQVRVCTTWHWRDTKWRTRSAI
jgi:hypothetical protein